MIKDITIIITHVGDTYLEECLEIIDKTPLLKGIPIWTDGYRSLYKGNRAYKSTEHKLCHGERAFELISCCETSKALIMDADFFCADDKFWEAVLNASQSYKLVSIGASWRAIPSFPTTPFFVCDCKKMIENVPVRCLWKHFSETWPELGKPIFDHMKFPFLAIYEESICVDNWYPISKRKYSFFHFWDSRHSPEKTFQDFDEGKVGVEYLSYGISKSIYYHAKKGLLLSDREWGYIEYLFSLGNKRVISNLVDVMTNLQLQIRKGICADILYTISKKFFKEFNKRIKNE